MNPTDLHRFCTEALANELGLRIRIGQPLVLRDQLNAYISGVPEFAGLVAKVAESGYVHILKPSATLP